MCCTRCDLVVRKRSSIADTEATILPFMEEEYITRKKPVADSHATNPLR